MPIAPATAASSPRLDWADIARRSLRFEERLAPHPHPETAPPLAIRLWARLLGDIEPGERWRRRLRWDGWSAGQALAAFDTGRATLVPPLRFPTPLLDALTSSGEPDLPRWAAEVFDQAVPEASVTQRRALQPLEQALADRLRLIAADAIALTPTLRVDERLQRFPVIARQWLEAMQQAAAEVRCVHLRLLADGPARATRFGAALAGYPRRVEPSTGDRHDGGQRVLRLGFDAGALYYKPRALDLDTALAETVRRCREHGLAMAAVPESLALDGYGYQRGLEALARGDALPEATFSGIGGLAALGWLGNARDLHADNLLLTAGGLAVVDVETFLQPERPGGNAFEHGPLASALFDFREAVGGADAAGIRVLERHLGRSLSADEQALVVAGFEATLHAVRGSPALMQPLLDYAGPVRVVYRPSARYDAVLGLLREARAQTDGALGILATDSLHADLLAYPEPPPEWCLSASERQQLEAGDVPCFRVPARAIGPEGGPALFARSAADSLRHRLDGIGPSIHRATGDVVMALRVRGRLGAAGLASKISGWHATPWSLPLLRHEAGRLLRAALTGDAAALAAGGQALAGGPLPDEQDLDAGVAGLLLAFTVAAMRGHAVDKATLAPLAARLEGPGLPLGYSGQPQAGLAHGLSGMALALALAGRQFGEAGWTARAARLWEAEDTLFDAAEANWPAAPGQPAVLNAWCNGATGILLARAMAGMQLDTPAALAARAALRDLPPAGIDHLCCGELGRVLAWQGIAWATGDEALGALAIERCLALESRWASNGERLEADAGGLLLRDRAGLHQGWQCVSRKDLPNPVLLGLRWSELHG